MAEQDQEVTKTRLWDRPATRRVMLAAGATGAAGGAAALVFGLSGDDDGAASASAGAAATATATTDATATSGPTATAVPTQTIGQLTEAQRQAGHLLRRAGFGGTPDEIDEFAGLSREEAANRLVDYESIDNSALEEEMEQFDIYRGDDLYRMWLTRMAHTARPLEERMSLIWHGLLVTQITQLGGFQPLRIRMMDDQIGLYRSMALPVYDDLLKAVSKDPAMMRYLNTADSTKEHPNENYGRELLELFSMGVDTYTEDDVREAARAFTGWRMTRPERIGGDQQPDRDQQIEIARGWAPEFFVSSRDHDNGAKTLLGQTGNWDGDDIVDIVMASNAPGRFITRRLFTEFVHDHPSEESINALEAVWDDSGHDVREVVRAILVSDEFYSDEAYRGKVRSPVELVVGAVRGLGLDWDFRGLERVAAGMDQTLLNPPNVAGWPGGDAWLSSGTFFARVNFIDILLFHQTLGRDRRGPGSLVSTGFLSEATTAEDAVDIAVNTLIDGNIADSSRQLMYDYVATAPDRDQKQRAAAYLVLASPEFQTT